MIYPLLVKHFFRQRATIVATSLLLALGVISIGIGKQFLNQQSRNVQAVEETQERHLKQQLDAHPDDLGLVLFYLKFAYINPIQPLAGLAIGQADLTNNIQHITLLALEGQKYDTDLISPVRLQSGNLDLSFVITFLFPLVIIALCFNLLQEEIERGTWKLIQVQGVSPFRFIVGKWLVRLALVWGILLILFIIAGISFAWEWTSPNVWLAFLQSALYCLFWFSLCLCVVALRLNSSTSAVLLLSLWLLTTILLPAGASAIISTRYPIEEALELTIKQRDGYHSKWDTNKQATVDKFNECYPQLSQYKLSDSGFTWHWYYAMQHMGDLESRAERQGMLRKIETRQRLTGYIANVLPSVKLQLGLTALAHTDLDNYLHFLEATTDFHESKRLALYPAIFENLPATSIDWQAHQPEFYQPKDNPALSTLFLSLTLTCFLLLTIALFRLRNT